MDYAASGLVLPQYVMRQPRGPADKGKGFQKWCRTRMEPAVSRKPGSKAVPIVAPPPAQSPSIAKEEAKKEETKPAAADEGAAAADGAVAMPVIRVKPVIVIQEDSESSDEGHFSDAPLENEKSR
jgi:hypothetical protein